MYKLAEFEKKDGNLHITLTQEGRAELETIRESGDHVVEGSFLTLIGWQLCNGWEAIQPEEVGALTDGLIITDAAVRDDDGVLSSVGRVYWQEDYAVTDPIDELERTGLYVMTGKD